MRFVAPPSRTENSLAHASALDEPPRQRSRKVPAAINGSRGRIWDTSPNDTAIPLQGFSVLGEPAGLIEARDRIIAQRATAKNSSKLVHAYGGVSADLNARRCIRNAATVLTHIDTGDRPAALRHCGGKMSRKKDENDEITSHDADE